MSEQELLRKIREHYGLMLRLAEGSAIYEIRDGKRIRVSLAKAIASECRAALDSIPDPVRA